MSIYLKYGKGPDIKGAVTDKGYKDWFAVDSVSFGFDRPVEMKVGQSVQSWKQGTVRVEDISCNRTYDMASPLLYKHSVGGGKEADVEIHWVETKDGKPHPILVMKLKNVLVVNYADSSGGDDAGDESFDLNYTDIDIEFKSTDKVGGFKPARFHYDVLGAKG